MSATADSLTTIPRVTDPESVEAARAQQERLASLVDERRDEFGVVPDPALRSGLNRIADSWVD